MYCTQSIGHCLSMLFLAVVIASYKLPSSNYFLFVSDNIQVSERLGTAFPTSLLIIFYSVREIVGSMLYRLDEVD